MTFVGGGLYSEQITDYYPFGMSHSTGVAADIQPYKFGGKVLLTDVGLNWYDFSARMYDPALGRFMSNDPLTDKYYPVSPHWHCANNQTNTIDPTGKDSMVVGSGTSSDPYVIIARYYYKNRKLSEEQIKGLNAAISAYNNKGKHFKVKNKDGDDVYVKFDLSAEGVDDVGKAVSENIFTYDKNEPISFGNNIDIAPINTAEDNNKNKYGEANGWGVNLLDSNIENAVKEQKYNKVDLIKSTFIHEIGHNLGLNHSDKTNIMSKPNATTTNSQLNGTQTVHYYPSVDKNGIRILVNQINAPRNNSLGILRFK